MEKNFIEYYSYTKKNIWVTHIPASSTYLCLHEHVWVGKEHEKEISEKKDFTDICLFPPLIASL